MHTTPTSTESATRSPARRLGAILFGLVIAGSAAFGVQTLLAAPVIDCSDPILTCSLGGNERCTLCCLLTDPEASGGTCAFGQVCLCTYG
jgi:hypothetical protein